MFRCVVSLKNGEIKAKNHPSKDDCDTWLIGLIDKKFDLKRAVIENKDNKKERYIENF